MRRAGDAVDTIAPPLSRRRWRPGRCIADACCLQPLGHLDGVEPDQVTQLDVRDPPLASEAAYVPWRDPKVLGDGGDVHQSREGSVELAWAGCSDVCGARERSAVRAPGCSPGWSGSHRLPFMRGRYPVIDAQPAPLTPTLTSTLGPPSRESCSHRGGGRPAPDEGRRRQEHTGKGTLSWAEEGSGEARTALPPARVGQTRGSAALGLRAGRGEDRNLRHLVRGRAWPGGAWPCPSPDR
jgi:hypothetical protein